MEFFIRKNSTLPILEIDLFKDGKLDYNYKDSIFSSSTITFAMKDVDTDFYRITNGTCTYSIENQTIYYQFTKKNTSKVGRFIGEFTIQTSQGKIILPTDDRLFIDITDSFVDSNFCCGASSSPVITSTPIPTNTPTPTPTPTITTTPTPTPSPTPTSTPFVNSYAYLFIEPISASTNIGQWMYDSGSNFFGFTNTSQPSQNQTLFNFDLNTYVSYSGWTGGSLPSVIRQIVPQENDHLDDYGNQIVKYNFVTTAVPSRTTRSVAWYTWIIPTGATGGEYQTDIDFNYLGNPNNLTPAKTEQTIYTYTFTYTGNTIPQDTYRVYTTFPNETFRLSNNETIYFRGNATSN